MSAADRTYLELLERTLNGERRSDRTGVGTIGLFGLHASYSCDPLPLLTSKRVAWRAVVAELLWFISGDTDARTLQRQGVKIWDAWATAEQCAAFGREAGDLGPIYGKQWRSYGASGVDQLRNAVELLRRDPCTRRAIVSAWSPEEVSLVTLPPCHTLFQFSVRSPHSPKLDCAVYQRSGDMFLGVPFNIASYALLTVLVARDLGISPGDLTHVIGDAHVYETHTRQVSQQLGRRRSLPDPPRVTIEGPRSVFDIRAEHIHLHDYEPLPAIKAPVAV